MIYLPEVGTVTNIARLTHATFTQHIVDIYESVLAWYGGNNKFIARQRFKPLSSLVFHAINNLDTSGAARGVLAGFVIRRLHPVLCPLRCSVCHITENSTNTPQSVINVP